MDRYQTFSCIDMSQKVYAIDDILESIFQGKMLEKLMRADMIIFAYEGTQWYWSHTSPELYVKNKYGIEADMIDIRECGSSCVMNAVKFLHGLSYYQKPAIISVKSKSIDLSPGSRPTEDTLNVIFLYQ